MLSLHSSVQLDRISSPSLLFSPPSSPAPQCALIGFCASALPLSRNAGQCN